MLTHAILARSKKRNFTAVIYSRSTDIWESRERLVQYEAALELEGQIDEIWGTVNGTTNNARARSRSVASKTPVPTMRETRSVTKSPDKSRRKQDVDAPVENDRDSLQVEGSVCGEPAFDKPRQRDAREVKTIFERAYPMWKELVASSGDEEARGKGLERFHHGKQGVIISEALLTQLFQGHVLTRIVCKGTQALGILKEHERELVVLEELLAQRRWRRGRRGRWHERRALILMTHSQDTRATLEKAREAVLEGLKDEDTHIGMSTFPDLPLPYC